jgi:predicted RNA-binding Zn-ribbon protein involved in translation (DUF1610 family)
MVIKGNLMPTKRPKQPQPVEDVDAMHHTMACSNGHDIQKSGRWFRQNLTFPCPTCGVLVVHSEEQLQRRFADTVAHLRRLHAEGLISIMKPDGSR